MLRVDSVVRFKRKYTRRISPCRVPVGGSRAMVKLCFQNESGLRYTCDVQSSARLSMVQRKLCKLFGIGFPKMKASLTIRGARFDDFLDQPFLEASEGDVVTVSFAKTDDPFFYDLADRLPTRYSFVEQEICDDREESAMVSVEKHRSSSPQRLESTRSDAADHVAKVDDDLPPNGIVIGAGRRQRLSS